MSDESAAGPAPVGNAAFPTTHWSMVLHAGASAETQARGALESLCTAYWYPLYVFVRRQGRPHHEAEDCTQEFLARLLAADGIAQARRERGRFRTFLLTALRNFLTNEWRRAQCEKRGGGRTIVSLQLEDAEGRFAQEPPGSELTPEQSFDRNWALGLIESVIGELRAEYEKSGRGVLFRALHPLVWGHAAPEPSAVAAAQAGMTAAAFSVALHRLRQRLAQRLRQRVAETVADGADIEAELRHLIAAVSNRAAT